MPISILMPALSPTMNEGNLARWLKKEGDHVKPGEVIAEIETDKAVMEVEAVDEGILARILVPAGTENVKVNEPIALLLEEGEDSTALAQMARPKEDQKTITQPSEKTKTQAASGQKLGENVIHLPKGQAKGRPFASPLARRLAEEKQIPLEKVEGSGPYGRIVKKDIEAYQISAQTIPKSPQMGFVETPQESQLIPHSSMRKTIARRLVEAKSTIPHFYLTIDCDITDLVQLRSQFNTLKENVKISLNDFLIRASALALQKVPEANASWSEEGILRHKNADIAVAVAVPNGLITPIVTSAHLKDVTSISLQMKDLIARAKESKLRPEEYQGGGFTLSNLGMYGIKEFAAIINPPQASILAVGAGIETPVVKNGQIVIRSMMSCTLSVDHRVIDGAIGANFLDAFKKFVETPLSLLS